MECGLVLDRIVGAGGAAAAVRQRPTAAAAAAAEEEEEEGAMAAAAARGRRGRRRGRRWTAGPDLLLSVLSVFHLDNQHVSERALENYRRVYGGREMWGREDDFRKRVAVAFSVANTLARLGFPRPPSYVAHLCDVPVRALLNLPRSLGLTEEELSRLRPEDYELRESSPQEYVDAACSHLGVSFSRAGEAAAEAERVEWAMHGRHPTVLAAAAIQLVLSQSGELSGEKKLELCDLFDCRPSTLNSALRQWPSRV